MPHHEVYRRMDSSLATFFLKREYTLDNFNFLLNILAEQEATDRLTAVLEKMQYLQIAPN